MLRHRYDEVGFPWRRTTVSVEDLPLSMYVIVESSTFTSWRSKLNAEEISAGSMTDDEVIPPDENQIEKGDVQYNAELLYLVREMNWLAPS